MTETVPDIATRQGSPYSETWKKTDGSEMKVLD